MNMKIVKLSNKNVSWKMEVRNVKCSSLCCFSATLFIIEFPWNEQADLHINNFIKWLRYDFIRWNDKQWYLKYEYKFVCGCFVRLNFLQSGYDTFDNNFLQLFSIYWSLLFCFNKFPLELLVKYILRLKLNCVR